MPGVVVVGGSSFRNKVPKKYNPLDIDGIQDG